MVTVLDRAPADQLLLLVKALRNLSMFDGALDALERAGAIARLVPLLAARAAAPEVQNQALMACHYMCKIKNARKEALAAAGIVPHLQRFVAEDHPLKQFALPSIRALATCSALTRAALNRHDGVEFFLRQLGAAGVC